MGRTIRAGGVVLVAMVTAGTAAAAPMKCAKPDEVSAIQAAAVQQELMVAALTCNQITNFNAFQTGFSAELRASDDTLQKMFRRLMGNLDGTAAYHAFKTRLANNSSIRSIRDNANYCKEAGLVFAAALTAAKPALSDFVAGVKVTEESPVDTCDITVATGLQGASAGPAIVPKPNPLRVANIAPPDAVPPPVAPAAAPPAPTNTPVQAAAAPAAAAPAIQPGVLPDSATPPANTAAAAPPPDKKSSGWQSGSF